MVECERQGKNEEQDGRKRGIRIYWRKSRKKDGRQSENSWKCVAEEPGILEDDPSEQLISPANVIAVIKTALDVFREKWAYPSGASQESKRRRQKEGRRENKAEEFKHATRRLLLLFCQLENTAASSTNNSTETNQMHWCLRIRRPENQ